MYRLKRVNREESRLLGVCGGLSKYLDPEADPVITRLLWVFATILSPFMFILYFALAIVLKREPEPIKEVKEENKKTKFKDFNNDDEVETK